MSAQALPGGTFTMADGLTVTRLGYGAMQLAGPHVFGPPADRDEAIAVLREVVEAGITHTHTHPHYRPPPPHQTPLDPPPPPPPPPPLPPHRPPPPPPPS